MIRSTTRKQKAQSIIVHIYNRCKEMNYYLLYTILFACMCIIVFSSFYLNGKSFVLTGDGLTQHFNALAYYGKWLRRIVRGILFKHTLSIPMWDLSIGYGSDIITTLHYYVIGDPVNLLSILVPARYTEYLYDFLILLRIYLAGCAFSYFARKHGNHRAASLTGTLVYCFCGYLIMSAVRHPYFTNAMIYFPLILVGADRILSKKKPTLFIGMLAIACMSNFYFAYMICILTMVYVIIHYIGLHEKIVFGETCKMCLKFIAFGLVGIAMAGVIMVPVTNLLLTTNRMAAQNKIPVLYTYKYYVQLLGNFASANNSSWTCMGFSAVSVIAILCLFMKKGRKELKAGCILLTIMLLIPYVAHVMNGFSYAANRWCWGYAALIAYIIVKMLPEIQRLTLNELTRIFIGVLIFLGISMLDSDTRSEVNMINGVLMLGICMLLYLSLQYKGVKRWSSAAILLVTMVSLSMNAFYYYNLEEGDYVAKYVDSGQAYSKLTSNLPCEMVKTLSHPGVARYDQRDSNKAHNVAMQNKLYGTDYYFSLNNGYISDYLNEMYLNTAIEDQYKDLDGRTILDTLASVKYFIIPEESKRGRPYTFSGKPVTSLELEDTENSDTETGLPVADAEKTKINGQTGEVEVAGTKYNLYKSKYALPLGYTYDSYIKQSEYEKMDVVDKQEAMLQGVVLNSSTAKETQVTLTNQEIPYTIKASGNIKVQDGSFEVYDADDAKLTINFDGLTNSETYLIFDQLTYTAKSPVELYNDALWDSLTTYRKKEARFENKGWYPEYANIGTIQLQGNGQKTAIECYTPYNNFYSGKTNYLVNIGYRKSQMKKITITFNDPGIYSFSKLRVVCQPMQNVKSQIKKLKEESLRNVKLGTNKITGRISCSKAKILCMSIPYNEGWTAYIDGRKAEVKQANTMYLAIEVPEGEHNVEFDYTTPKIIVGVLASLLGTILYILVILFYKARGGRKK